MRQGLAVLRYFVYKFSWTVKCENNSTYIYTERALTIWQPVHPQSLVRAFSTCHMAYQEPNVDIEGSHLNTRTGYVDFSTAAHLRKNFFSRRTSVILKKTKQQQQTKTCNLVNDCMITILSLTA